MAARGIVGQCLAGRARLRGVVFPLLASDRRAAVAGSASWNGPGGWQAPGGPWRLRGVGVPCWAADRAQRGRSWPAGTGRADGNPLAARGIVGQRLAGRPVFVASAFMLCVAVSFCQCGSTEKAIF